MFADIYHIDAFTSEVFKGNPACVVVLPEKISDSKMLAIAAENGVAETAFLLKNSSIYSLRWFTPDIEMDLCGHATLAAAFVVYNYFGLEKAVFDTAEGIINVYKEAVPKGGERFILDFPVRKCEKSILPEAIYTSLNIKPCEVYLSRDYILLYESADDVLNVSIKRSIFDTINLDPGGVAVTAKGDDCDFVSRFFTPQATILEDPVTGSAHCTLAPFWAERLGKNELFAKQLSKRGGELICKMENDRVYIKGSAVCYSKGRIFI